jgi:hypothetical protein
MQCACAVLYCRLWPVRLYHISPYYLINAMIYGRQVTENNMCVLTFPTTGVWNICHCKKYLAKPYHKCTNVVMQRTRYSCHILMKIWFFSFSKNTQISNFLRILPVEAELFHADGRTDRYNEANSHFLKFCECAKNSNFWLVSLFSRRYTTLLKWIELNS